MSGNEAGDVWRGWGPYTRRVGLALLGVTAILIATIALEDYVGIPFDTTYRVACAAACLLVIYKWQSDSPEDHWPKISFWLALLINIGVFFTPLTDRPTSRGELLFFAAPDVVVALIVRIATHRAIDQKQRAARLRMIVILLLAIAFCAGIFGIGIAESRGLL